MLHQHPFTDNNHDPEMKSEDFETVTSKKTPRKYDAIISGSGPAALALAYELIIRNYHILLIDIHDESIRPQLVFLGESIDYLKRMVAKSPMGKEDQEFINKMKDIREHYNIKDIERFLKRRIEGHKNCRFMKRACIKKINMKKGIVDVKTQSGRIKTLRFKHLFGADGANHPTADILKKKGYETGYHLISSHKRIHHITAYFTIKSRSDTLIPHLTESSVLSQIIDLDRYLFHYTERSSHEKSNGKKMKACLTMTLPQALYEKWETNLKIPALVEQTRQEMQDEIHQIAQRLYPEQDIVFPKSRKHGPKKDKLKMQLFKAELAEADHAAILVNGHMYARLGDAFRKPDFYQGHGVRLGFMEARSLAHALDTLPLEDALIEYIRFCREVSDIAIDKTARTEAFLDRRFIAFQHNKLVDALETKDMSGIHQLLCHPLYDPNQTDAEGMTPFTYVIKYKNHEALRAFLQCQKTNPNQVDIGGNTPLHLAIHYFNIYAIQVLLDSNKIKPHQKNNNNQTPLQLAMQAPYNYIVDLFREAILKEIKQLIIATPFRTTEWEAKTGCIIEIYGKLKTVPRAVFAMWKMIEEFENKIYSADSALEKIIQIGSTNALHDFLSGTTNIDRAAFEFFEKFTSTGEYAATQIFGKSKPLHVFDGVRMAI